jgi:hypothetical protein
MRGRTATPSWEQQSIADAEQRPPRRYYTITPSGRQQLREPMSPSSPCLPGPSAGIEHASARSPVHRERHDTSPLHPLQSAPLPPGAAWRSPSAISFRICLAIRNSHNRVGGIKVSLFGRSADSAVLRHYCRTRARADTALTGRDDDCFAFQSANGGPFLRSDPDRRRQRVHCR